MKSAIFLGALAVCVTCSVVGVAPHEQVLYEPKIGANGQKLWSCLSDPSITLSYDQINDDYCDCPDGSDEPGTNACPVNASKPFYCENKGHFPAYIDNFKLNDGACDYDVCCDGSDEYLTGQCPDKCDRIHQQYLSYAEQHNKDVEKSSKVQKQLIAAAENYVKEMVDHVKKLKDDLEAKKGELSVLNSRLEEESNRNVGQIPTVFDHLAEPIDSIAKRFAGLLTRQQNQGETVQRLEEILGDLIANYNPNFNDAAVKSAVSKFQDYISNKEQTSDDIPSPDDLIQALTETAKALTSSDQPVTEFVVPSITNMFRYYYKRAFDYLAIEPQTSRKEPGVVPPANEVIASIEKAIDATNKAVQNIQTEIEIFEEDLNTNYGPKNMLRALKKVVVNKKIGEYNYQVNILDGVYQDQTVVGRFSHYKDGKLYYLEGQKCWNGPRRQAVVQLVCGASHEIVSAAELEKCQYYLELSSPIACTPVSEAELKKNFKINYDLL